MRASFLSEPSTDWIDMNKIMKNLKLACIACLFLGLAALIVGVVSGISTVFDTDAIATVACGLGSAPAGAQSSRLANVPSNAAQVRAISLVILLGTTVFAVAAYMLGNPTPLQLGAFALVWIAALLMAIFSHQEVKQLERV
jgi:hypothetical protein